MRCLVNTSLHDQQWESNNRPFNIECNALPTGPQAAMPHKNLLRIPPMHLGMEQRLKGLLVARKWF